MADKIAEKAAKLILGTEAQSRFTRTPIKINDKTAWERMLRSTRIPSWLTPVYDYPATGTFERKSADKPQGFITVENNQLYPRWDDIVGTMHHEDIHKVLSDIPEEILSSNYVGYPDVSNAYNAFTRGLRLGDPKKELPAYVGAFKPGELHGFTENDRQQYLNRFIPTIPEPQRSLLQRIIENFNASRNPPFETR